MSKSPQNQEQSVPSPIQEQKYGIQINKKVYVLAFAIFLCLIIIMGILTRIFPQGAYDRQVIDGVEYVIDGTYHEYEDQNPLPVWCWFTAPFELMVSDSGLTNTLLCIIIMIIGGLYAVLDKSGLIKRFFSSVVRRLHKKKYLMLAVITLSFIIFGSVVGEVDSLPLIVPLTVALSFAMGWDSLVGIGMVFLASIRGFAASTFNPYTVGIAQALAGVPLYSGTWLRFIILGVTIVALLAWLLSYAYRIEKDPKKSLMYEEDSVRRKFYSYDALIDIPKQRYPFKEMLVDFWRGAISFFPLIFIMAMIMSLSYILTEGLVIDTIIYKLSQVITVSNPTLAALQMLLTTLIVEIFVSGSFIKAYLLMPIFVPLGDVAGLTRQMVCQIFILGDSFPNTLYPTDVTLMFVLSLTGCNYTKWLRWSGPFLLGMMVFCCLIIVFAVNVGYR